jgi:hypothetical protein
VGAFKFFFKKDLQPYPRLARWFGDLSHLMNIKPLIASIDFIHEIN